MSSSKAPTSLQRLINEPKGKTEYKSGEAFLLHVFWEAPSDKAANSLLDALSQCAAARKDTYLGIKYHSVFPCAFLEFLKRISF